MSASPFNAEPTDTAISGALVPNATMVRPMTSGEMPNDSASRDAPRTSSSAPATSAPSPSTKNRNEINQPTTRMWTRYGPCAPSTIVCSMSPVRDGPEIMLIARGRRSALGAHQRERLLHAGDDAVAADDGDPGVGQQRRRGRRVGAGQDHQRAGLGDRAERAGDAQPVVALRRPWLDGEPRAGPVEIGEFGPADARVRALRGERRRQLQRVDVAGNGARDLAAVGDASTVLAMSRARWMNFAASSAGIAGRGPCGLRGDVRLGGRARRAAVALLAQRLAHAPEDGVARRAIVGEAHAVSRSRRP